MTSTQTTTTNYEKVSEIRSKLRRTWQPFFSGFGNLTPVQLAVIPRILAGKNLLVSAPSASGKTEAVVAPICELMLESNQTGLGCVYVSPTRALVNDLAGRLTGPLKDVGIRLGIWTGDHHDFHPKNPEELLLLTPESLDSVLCRFVDSFATLKFVVFDELHLIDGTCRGDQLAILRRRLSKRTGSLKFYGLSATIKNLEEVAGQYLGRADVARIPGVREIREHYIDGHDIDAALSELTTQFRNRGLRKALFFCNSRAQTETVGNKLQSYVEAHRVVVHHGSLPKDRREAAERAFKEMKFCFCVATMTLEVGIDIGDVDATVLVGAPPSISSLLQRIGRGNRRQEFTNVFGIVRSENEKAMLSSLFEWARRGELEDVTRNPCLSVSVQQILSIAFQHRLTGIKRNEIFELLQWLSQDDVSLLLAHLKEEDYLVEQRGLVFPSEKTLDLARLGKIHSNIGDDRSLEVINRQSGEKLGEVGLIDAHSGSLILGGRIWKVVRVTKREVYVDPGGSRPREMRFARRRETGAFYDLLPQSLKERSDC